MSKDVIIPIVKGVAGKTRVKIGDKVQWTATELSFVIPPDIFSGNECKSQFSVPGDGTPAPSKACHVTGRDGDHPYLCGVGASGTYKERVGSSNDVIVIEPGRPLS